MTMPNERMRALRWGHELLAEMPLDPSLPQACRAESQRLGRKHPSPQELEQWVQAGQHGLPMHWAVAIARTYEFFTETQRRAEGSAQTQSALLHTLRHYPDMSTARAMTSDRAFTAWLELE